jgi:hypothetical protein
VEEIEVAGYKGGLGEEGWWKKGESLGGLTRPNRARAVAIIHISNKE